MHLSITCFGGFQLRLNNQPLPTSRAKKIEGLLAYLVTHAHQPQLRTTLDRVLYPDLSEKAARANLRQTIARLRRALNNSQATPPFILTDQPDTIQFNRASNYTADIDQFQQKIAGCEAHQSKASHPKPPAPTCPDCMTLLQEAVALYGGAFLAGFSLPDSDQFDQWADRHRQRFEQTVLDGWQTLADYFTQRGDYATAYTYVQNQLAIVPWREAAYRQGMRLLARQGQRAPALALFQRCESVLADQLNLAPMAETVTLAAKIVKLGQQRRTALPYLNPSFIGRDKEVGDVLAQLVAPAGKLITLVGSGGIGKTQLALQVGHQIANDYLGPFMDGVFFIPAGNTPLTSALPLINPIMAALDLPLSGHISPLRALQQALHHKECLLIFDNGEYLSHVGRRLISDLLHTAPTVQILVTSRERLNLAQEWVIELDGLPYPPRPAQQNLPTRPQHNPNWQTYAAVQLFAQRAQQAQATFSLAAQAEGVIATCQLVQGLPLALELAATWVRVLSCADIAARIRRTTDTLATTLYDWPERHRSMRLVFENSWELLPPAGQILLANLTIFHGTFTFVAAEAIVGATLVSLADLVDRSLVKSRPGTPAPLFELHPLLHQFATERLAAERLTPLSTTHATYYAHFLQQFTTLTGQHHAPSLRAIEETLPNIRAGWQWAIDTADLTLISHYMPTLYTFYMMRGWRHEGRETFQKALVLQTQHPDLHTLPADHALVLTGLLTRIAGFDYEIGLIDEAQTLIQTSLQIGHRVEDPHELSLAYKRLGEITHKRGDYAQALKLLQFSLQIAQEENDPTEIAHRHLNLGAVYRDMGDLPEAQTHFAHAVALSRQAESAWGLAHALRLLSIVIYQQDDKPTAATYYHESLQLSRTIGDKISESLALLDWGQCLFQDADYAGAEPLFMMALQFLEAIPYDKGIALARYRMGQLLFAQQRYGATKTQLYTAFQTAVATQDLPLVLQVILDMVRLTAAMRPTESLPNAAVLLLGMVVDHPAGTPILQQQASQLQTDLNLPPTPTSPLSLQDVEHLIATINP